MARQPTSWPTRFQIFSPGLTNSSPGTKTCPGSSRTTSCATHRGPPPQHPRQDPPTQTAPTRSAAAADPPRSPADSTSPTSPQRTTAPTAGPPPGSATSPQPHTGPWPSPTARRTPPARTETTPRTSPGRSDATPDQAQEHQQNLPTPPAPIRPVPPRCSGGDAATTASEQGHEHPPPPPPITQSHRSLERPTTERLSKPVHAGRRYHVPVLASRGLGVIPQVVHARSSLLVRPGCGSVGRLRGLRRAAAACPPCCAERRLWCGAQSARRLRSLWSRGSPMWSTSLAGARQR